MSTAPQVEATNFQPPTWEDICEAHARIALASTAPCSYFAFARRHGWRAILLQVRQFSENRLVQDSRSCKRDSFAERRRSRAWDRDAIERKPWSRGRLRGCMARRACLHRDAKKCADCEVPRGRKLRGAHYFLRANDHVASGDFRACASRNRSDSDPSLRQ